MKKSFLKSVWFSLKKTRLIILGGIFFILIFGLLFYFWPEESQPKDFIPPTAVFYLELNNSLNESLPLPFFDELYAEVDKAMGWQDFSFKDNLLPHLYQKGAAALLLSEFNPYPDLVLILKIKDAQNLRPYFSKFPNIFLQNNLLITANSSAALQAAIEAGDKNRISIKERVISLFDRNYLKLFISQDFLKNNLNLNQELTSFFNYLTAKNDISGFYLKMNKIGVQWQFEISPAKFLAKKSLEFFSPLFLKGLKIFNPFSKNIFIEESPENFLFSTQPINLVNFFKNLGEVDNNLAIALDKNFKSYLALYNFDFEKEILPIFDKATQLIIFKKDQPGILPFDFLIILPKIEPEKLKAIEVAAMLFLISKFPQEKKRILPDSTSVIELIAQPDKFIFQKDLTSDLEINYLTAPEINFEFVYADLEKETILSSNKDLIKNIFIKSNQRIIIPSSFSADFNFLLKLKNLPKDFLGLFKYLKTDLIFGQQNQNGDLFGYF